MSLSVGGLSNDEYSVVRPMNYSVENHSKASDAYTKSVEQTDQIGSFRDILPVHPTGYANAQTVRVDAAAQLEQTRKASQEFNRIAGNFAGMSTGYTDSSAALSYEMIGSNVDLFI